MKQLSELPLDQLALALTGELRLPMHEVLAELHRRQAMLDATERLAGAAKDASDWLSPDRRAWCQAETLADLKESLSDALNQWAAAYAEAKESR